MILKTDRLILRPISPDDKFGIFEYRSDAETNRYQGWIPDSIGDVEVFIGKISMEMNVPGTWFQFVILEKETRKIVGDLGIHFLDPENKQAELGCTLGKEFQKIGYARESLKRVIDYLFRELNKHRVIASVDPANANAIRLVERLGFRKEAHFVESLWFNGRWVDDLIYAILEKEWEIDGDPPLTLPKTGRGSGVR